MSQPATVMADISISRYILRGVSTAYGLVCLATFAIMALSDGAAFRRASRKEQDELSVGTSTRLASWRHGVFSGGRPEKTVSD